MTSAEVSARPTTLPAAGKYLTVTLDRESYCLPVLKVREIARMQRVTPVPQMPDFVRGVLNLRGRVIPVIDLRLKLGLEATFTDHTCIVVAQSRRPSGALIQLGLIVDTVDEVISLQTNEISSFPDLGTTLESRYLHGLANLRGQVKTILDLDRLIAPDLISTLADLPSA